MGAYRRRFILALLGLWILTTGSSCQSTVTATNFRAQGSGAGVIIVVLAGAGIACLISESACAEPEPGPFDEVQTTFETGVDLMKRGDAAGLYWICVAGQQGYAKAQYYYGVHLFRRDPADSAASLAWLKRAAAQDHKAARHLVLQMTDWRKGRWDGPLPRPRAVAPPALRACIDQMVQPLQEATAGPLGLPG